MLSENTISEEKEYIARDDLALREFLSVCESNCSTEIIDSDPKPDQVRRSILAAMRFLNIQTPSQSVG